jgi:hypothetical protein
MSEEPGKQAEMPEEMEGAVRRLEAAIDRLEGRLDGLFERLEVHRTEASEALGAAISEVREALGKV